MSVEISDLEMDLMAAAVPAEFAPTGVSVVLLSDALRIAVQFLKGGSVPADPQEADW